MQETQRCFDKHFVTHHIFAFHVRGAALLTERLICSLGSSPASAVMDLKTTTKKSHYLRERS